MFCDTLSQLDFLCADVDLKGIEQHFRKHTYIDYNITAVVAWIHYLIDLKSCSTNCAPALNWIYRCLPYAFVCFHSDENTLASKHWFVCTVH